MWAGEDLNLTDSVHLFCFLFRKAHKKLSQVFKSSQKSLAGISFPSHKSKKPHTRPFDLWAGEDLNLHSLRNQFLKLACIPFHHPPKIKYKKLKNLKRIINNLDFLTGASSRLRTCDLVLKRDLLYQLSYGRFCCLNNNIFLK